MADLELLARVRLLRAEGKAPKQIARILGLSPSVVPRWCARWPPNMTRLPSLLR